MADTKNQDWQEAVRDERTNEGVDPAIRNSGDGLLEIFGCFNCPIGKDLKDRGKEKSTFLPGRGSLQPDILIVTDVPVSSTDRFRHHEQHIGAYHDGATLKVERAIRERSPSYTKIRVTHAIKCPSIACQENHTPNLTSEVKRYIKECRGFLQEEIRELKPKAVLLMGSIPLFAALGIADKNMARNMGSVVVQDGVTYIVTCNLVQFNAINANSYFAQHKLATHIKLLVEAVHPPTTPEISMVNVHTEAHLAELRSALEARGKDLPVVFDYETDTNINSDGFEREDSIAGVGFALSPTRTFWMPLSVKVPPDCTLSEEKRYDFLRWFLSNENISKIAHNAAYEMMVSDHFLGLSVKNVMWDTMLMHHTLDPTQKTHSLKYLAFMYTPYGDYENPLKEALEALAAERSRVSYADVDYSLLSSYCCMDVAVTYLLFSKFKESLEKTPDLLRLYTEITHPSLEMVVDLKKHGIVVDEKTLDKIEVHYKKMQQEAEDEIRNNALCIQHNVSLEPGSKKQLSELLFDKVGLLPTKTTKTGLISCDEEALKKVLTLPDVSEDVSNLVTSWLKYTKATTYLSTFIVGFRPFIVEGRVHPNYLIIGTATGRLSSVRPNMLNTPSDYDENIPAEVKMKRIFTAPKRYKFLSADYSQIELRNAANCSHEPFLVEAYQKGQDVHEQTARIIFGSNAEITKKKRGLGKTVNFSNIYGAGVGRIAATIDKEAGLSDEELAEVVEELGLKAKGPSRHGKLTVLAEYIKRSMKNAWTKHEKWKREKVKQAEKDLFVTCPFGRIRYLGSTVKGAIDASSEFNKIINTPIQSVSSACALYAMVKIHNFLKKSKMKSRIIGQVYDSILFYIHEDEEAELLPKIKTLMIEAPRRYKPEFFQVGLEVDFEIGPNWGELEKIDVIPYGI